MSGPEKAEVRCFGEAEHSKAVSYGGKKTENPHMGPDKTHFQKRPKKDLKFSTQADPKAQSTPS